MSYYRDLITQVQSTPNPLVTGKIDVILVLTGRSDFKGNFVDPKLVDRWIHQGERTEHEIDANDTIDRFNFGVAIAKQVNALASTQQSVPVLVNGIDSQNHQLREMVAAGKVDYPNVMVEDIATPNTIGQVKNFIDILQKNSAIKQVAIVSSAYHLPRAALTFGNNSPHAVDVDGNPNALQQVEITLYGMDRQFKRPGAKLEIPTETDAMTNYAANGSIASKLADNITITQNQKERLSLLTQQQAAEPPEPSAGLMR